MRALVTGMTGFVGGHLAEHLTAAGDEVVGLSAHPGWPTGPGPLRQRVRVEVCDLATIAVADLADLLRRERPEAIYHLAALANPQVSAADPRGTWALNLGGALSLLEAVRAAGPAPAPRVLLVGSGISYGSPPPEHLPVTESCPLRPSTPYAASKAAAELLGIQHFLAHGTPVLMVRPFNHAGPRQADIYVLSSFARQVAEVELGRRARIEVGNLDVVRDFTDVRDVVRGYRLLVERGTPGEVYNLGSGRDVQLSALLEALRGLATVPIAVHVDPARVRPADQPRLLADASKLRAATGWEPRIPIEQTLRDTLDYWRQALRTPEAP